MSVLDHPKAIFPETSMEGCFYYFKNNPVVHACVSTISRSGVVVDVELSFLPTHINWINLIQLILHYLFVTGNCFLRKDFSLIEKVVAVILDKEKVVGYRLSDNSIISNKDVLHLKLFAAPGEFFGTSPVASAKKLIET
jgi:hypothetical protein